MNSYIIKVFLYDVEPKIWRRLSFPADGTFADLHEVIQKAMGWNDEQAHQFRHGKGKHLSNVISNVEEEIGPGDDFKNEKDVKLSNFVGRRRLPLRLLYRYDFFDDWAHEVVIESKGELENPPQLLDGERACPPEDCGGAFGYRECMNCFDEWMDDDYDPEKFDATEVKLS